MRTPVAPLLAMAMGILALEAAGCSRPQALTPPNVHWGQDVCSRCGMIVSEERFAAAACMDAGGGRAEPRVYDDIGCFLQDTGAAKPMAQWVHGPAGSGWIPAEAATYVHGTSLQTPMGSGVEGFATRDDAESLRTRVGGDVLDWNALRARWAKAAP